MKNVVIPSNLGNTFDIGTIEGSKIHVNIDGTTLTKAADGKISVDTSALAITVVSEDDTQVLVEGTDGGALLTKEVFQDLVGAMVVSATDGLTYDDAIAALTATVASAVGVNTDSVDTDASVSTDGVLSVSSTVNLDASADNMITTSTAGLMVDKADVVSAAKDATTNTHTVATDATFTTTVNDVATTTNIVEVQDAFGTYLGEMLLKA